MKQFIFKRAKSMKFSEKLPVSKQNLRYCNTVFYPVSDETSVGQNGIEYKRRVEYVFSPSAETSHPYMDIQMKVDTIKCCALILFEAFYDGKLVCNTWPANIGEFGHQLRNLDGVGSVRVVLTYLRTNHILLKDPTAV